MSRTSDVLKQAQTIREERLKNIEETLKSDFKTAVTELESLCKAKLSTIEPNLDKQVQAVKETIQDNIKSKQTLIQANMTTLESEIATSTQELQKTLQESLTAKITHSEAKIEALEKELATEVSNMSKTLKTQLASMKSDFQTFTELNDQIVKQTQLKKQFSRVVIFLASIACISLTVLIGLTYMGYNKTKEIGEMNLQIANLKKQGATLSVIDCDKKLCVEIDPKQLNNTYTTITTDGKQTNKTFIIVKEKN